MSRPTEGETHAFERTFTTEDVRRFADLSRDTQPQHTDPDSEGRLLVHGLLTATLPTKIGGDLEVLAHTMTLEFHRPVHTGERVRCEWTHESVEERDDDYAVTAGVVCTNEAGETVMTATIDGLLRKDG